MKPKSHWFFNRSIRGEGLSNYRTIPSLTPITSLIKKKIHFTEAHFKVSFLRMSWASNSAVIHLDGRAGFTLIEVLIHCELEDEDLIFVWVDDLPHSCLHSGHQTLRFAFINVINSTWTVQMLWFIVNCLFIVTHATAWINLKWGRKKFLLF